MRATLAAGASMTLMACYGGPEMEDWYPENLGGGGAGGETGSTGGTVGSGGADPAFGGGGAGGENGEGGEGGLSDGGTNP